MEPSKSRAATPSPRPTWRAGAKASGIRTAAAVLVCWGLSPLSAQAPAAPPQPDAPPDLLIRGGRVMDPETGLDAIRDVAIRTGRIVSLTPPTAQASAAVAVVDAGGLVVAPGFIDLNTYQHGDGLFRLRAADGVTSVLNLEGGAVDIEAYHDALAGRALLHHGAGLDHKHLRRLAQGDDGVELHNGVADWPGINATRQRPELDHEPLSAEQLQRLEHLVDAGLRSGAVGIGSGLEYIPGATHSEFLRVAGVAATHRAPVHVHLREFHPTRDRGQFYEVFGAAIHTGARLHVQHLNSSFASFTDEALVFLQRAREHALGITTECYPYIASATFIDAGSLDGWREWDDETFERFEWPPTGERLTRETFARRREEGGLVVIHPPSQANAEGRRQALRDCYAHDLPMVASDGGWDEGITHPRVAGTNSRILGRYVRELEVLDLMTALEKMTLAPARHLEDRLPQMRTKGRVQVGADADLVVFDPDTILDRATYRDPVLPPAGIHLVLVAGVPVVRDGEVVDGVHPGRPLRAPGAP